MPLTGSSGIPCTQLFFSFGVSLLSANWIVVLSYMLPTVSLYLVRVSDEEKMMIRQFGDRYGQYMTGTGRLIPKLRT